ALSEGGVASCRAGPAVAGRGGGRAGAAVGAGGPLAGRCQGGRRRRPGGHAVGRPRGRRRGGGHPRGRPRAAERPLPLGHSPTNEAAVLGLTGELVAPLAKGAGVLVAEDGGRYR